MLKLEILTASLACDDAREAAFIAGGAMVKMLKAIAEAKKKMNIHETRAMMNSVALTEAKLAEHEKKAAELKTLQAKLEALKD